MDINRRGFLKLFGLGGAAVAVGGPMMFSAQASTEHLLVGRAKHLVFDRSTRDALGVRLVPHGMAHFLSKAPPEVHSEYNPISRLLLGNPQRKRAAFYGTDRSTGQVVHYPAKESPEWAPAGDASVYQVNCPVRAGEDPHIAFFMAAATLQRQIHEDVQVFAKTLQQRSLVMITQVNTPVMAFPHPEKGFYLETQIEQFAVESSDIANKDDALSTEGEIPCETPNDITFKYLLLMQEELKAMGMRTWDPRKIRRKVAREAFRRANARRA